MKTSGSLFDIKMCNWMLIFIGLFLRLKGPFINFNLLTKNVQLVEEITCFLKKCIKSNLNDKEFLLITRILIRRSNYCLQDWKSICRSMNCLQMEEICANSKKYLICSSKNYQQIEKLFPMQIEELFVDWRIICRPKKYMQIGVRLQLEEVFHLQIKKLFADGRTVCR